MKKIIALSVLFLVAVPVFAKMQKRSNQDKPWRIDVAGDMQKLQGTDEWYPYGGKKNQTWTNYNHSWLSGVGGTGSYLVGDYEQWWWNVSTNGPASEWDGYTKTSDFYWNQLGYGKEVGYYSYFDNLRWNGFTNQDYIINRIGNEHCKVSDPISHANIKSAHVRTADTTWHVQTGGKAIPGMLNLCQFSASVWQINDKRAVPPFSGASMTEITNKSDIVIGAMGNLRPTGVRYNLLPNGAEYDITPKVAGNDFYKFTVSGQKYLSYFDVFVQQANPGGAPDMVYSDSYDVGHAFWQFRTDAPDEALQSLSFTVRQCLSNKWGFYPPVSSLFTQIGHVVNDSQHPFNVRRTFAIGFNGLLGGLNFTAEIQTHPPVYVLTGNNCVNATIDAGLSSGVFLPVTSLLWSPQAFGCEMIGRYPAKSGMMPVYVDEVDIFYSPYWYSPYMNTQYVW